MLEANEEGRGLQSSLHQSHTSACNSFAIFLAHCINIVFQNKMIVFLVLLHYCSNYAKFFIVQFMGCFHLPIIAYQFKFTHSNFPLHFDEFKKAKFISIFNKYILHR